MATGRNILLAAAAVFLAAGPVVAADVQIPTPKAPQAPTVQTPAIEKPDLGGALKQKASDIVDQAKTSVDKKADDLQKSLGVKKDGAKEQMVDVQEETVTVETPAGVGQETTITVTPETPATPAAPK